MTLLGAFCLGALSMVALLFLIAATAAVRASREEVVPKDFFGKCKRCGVYRYVGWEDEVCGDCKQAARSASGSTRPMAARSASSATL
jgi:hypothetical protein